MFSSTKSVARLALLVSSFSALSALADNHRHGHPVLGLPGPRPPVVVGLPGPHPRPPVVVGLPAPRPPVVVGLPAPRPPRPIGLPLPRPRPPVVVGIVVPRPPVVIGLPVPPPVVIGLPAPERYALNCFDTQGTAQEIGNVSLNLYRNGAESFRVQGYVSYTAGGTDAIDSVAYGYVGNQIDLRIQDVGDLRLDNGSFGAFRPFHQGAISLYGRSDRYGIGCTLVRQ